MLIIINEGKYSDFSSSRKKPSEYCKIDLRMSNVKSSDFIYGYFADVEQLICSIKKYHSLHDNKGNYTLKDLLKM